MKFLRNNIACYGKLKLMRHLLHMGAKFVICSMASNFEDTFVPKSQKNYYSVNLS